MSRLKPDVFEQIALAIDSGRVHIGEGKFGQSLRAITEVQREAITRAIADVLADHSPRFNMISFITMAGFKP